MRVIPSVTVSRHLSLMLTRAKRYIDHTYKHLPMTS